MIEINLVPDIKKELIKAQRVRTNVISLTILVGIVSLGIVVLLLFWVFGVQIARGALSDNTIKNESQKLSSVEDVSNTLTIQNQLGLLPDMHASKNISSRIFEILSTINPSAPNNVSVTDITVDMENSSIKIEAQAKNGYAALDVFKKTISATKFRFMENAVQQEADLATNMNDTERSYGEDSSGVKVLRFVLSFTYPDKLFSNAAKDATVVAPKKTNATDSYKGVPRSLFAQKATDIEEGK